MIKCAAYSIDAAVRELHFFGEKIPVYLSGSILTKASFLGVSVDAEGSSFLHLSGETGGAYVHEKACGGGCAVVERVRENRTIILLSTV
ncbi:MAG: hypothetical protein ACLTER_23365 [Ruminococcus sp.]